MINNVLQFVTNSAGESIDVNLGSVRRLSNLVTTIQVVSPLDNSYSVKAEFLLANSSTTFQYLRLALDSDGVAYKGIDVLDNPTEAQKDWNVWEVELSETTLSKISKFRAGKVGVSFIFNELVTSGAVGTSLGTFGSTLSTTGGDLPSGGLDHNGTALTTGDYYTSDLLTYTSTLTGNTYAYREVVYWNMNSEWVSGTTFSLIKNTTTKYFGVDTALTGQTPTISTTFEDQILVDLAELRSLESENAVDIDNLETLTTDYTTNMNQLDQNTTDIASNDADISAMKGAGWTTSNTIKGNSAAIALNDTDITALQAADSNLAGAGRTTETVKGNADNIASNLTDIEANTTDISTNASAIAVVEDDVAAIEAELLVKADLVDGLVPEAQLPPKADLVDGVIPEVQLPPKADLVDGLVPASQLPSFVDDVIEVTNFAALPTTGETGKLYLDLATSDIYRWSGSTYIQISDLLDAAEVKSLYEDNLDTNVFDDAAQSKLAGIEAEATADQTGVEIKTLYEANADTNAYTDAEKTKLSNIEDSATQDQTGAEIKALYEAELDTNALTDALKNKLDAIEDSATADQTASEIETLYEGIADTNKYTDAEKTKLDGIETAATADQTDLEIKTAYENNADTNAYTDAEVVKVGHISVTQAVDLDTMESQIATNVTDIGTNLASINSNDTDIANNLAAIQSNDTDIANNLAAIESNDTDIANNLAAIQSNDTDIATNAQDLADHEAETIGAHAATAISYDNSTSGLTAIEVKSAVDELDAAREQVVADWLTTFNGANELLQLDGDGLVAAANLPSYVDDVLEYATYALLPATGETGKIYVVFADENDSGNTSTYRWSGSTYIMISDLLDAAEVKALYEANANTNAFTDAEQTKVGHISITQAVDLDAMELKLDGIEDNATRDQTDEEIKIGYENNPDTNAYNDADKQKMDYITVTEAIDLDTLELDNSTITIAPGDWDTFTAIKAVLGVTSTNVVFVNPTNASYNDYIESEIFATAQGANSLTFTCGVTPTVSVDVIVVVGSVN